jgi:hypothetical protein
MLSRRESEPVLEVRRRDSTVLPVQKRHHQALEWPFHQYLVFAQSLMEFKDRCNVEKVVESSIKADFSPPTFVSATFANKYSDPDTPS